MLPTRSLSLTISKRVPLLLGDRHFALQMGNSAPTPQSPIGGNWLHLSLSSCSKPHKNHSRGVVDQGEIPPRGGAFFLLAQRGWVLRRQRVFADFKLPIIYRMRSGFPLLVTVFFRLPVVSALCVRAILEFMAAVQPPATYLNGLTSKFFELSSLNG